MDDDDESWSTSASTPGRIRVSWTRWLRYKPLWPTLFAVGAAGLIAAAILIHWVFWLPTACLLLIFWIYKLRLSVHFWRGDANPAIVVSLDPPLVAGLFEMSLGEGEYPAVKILPVKIEPVDGQEPRVGTRLVIIALYSGGRGDNPHWDDVDPHPAYYATSDRKRIVQLLKGFPEEAWEGLKRGLKALPRPFQPGIYFLDNVPDEPASRRRRS